MRFGHLMRPRFRGDPTNFLCGLHAKFSWPISASLRPCDRRRIALRPEYLPARIALVANALSMVILYPLNLLVLARASWVWDYPDRNLAMEHMLVAIYVTMATSLSWAARDPVKELSLIDFVIVSGAKHATTMAFDASHMPGLSHHLAFRGNGRDTYLEPIT